MVLRSMKNNHKLWFNCLLWWSYLVTIYLLTEPVPSFLQDEHSLFNFT